MTNERTGMSRECIHPGVETVLFEKSTRAPMTCRPWGHRLALYKQIEPYSKEKRR
jgi:hypothetical protein